MNLATIKEKLLKTGEFEDCCYLNDYCNLMLDGNQVEYISSKMNRHHIIPRSYYKYNNMEVDNSEDNIVNLMFKDHILAHYLLYKSSNSFQKYCNAHAVIHLTRQEHLTFENLSEMFPMINLDDCQILYEEFKHGLHDVLSNSCSGASNGNCKFKDLDAIAEVKYLLDNSKLSCSKISLITETPQHIVSSISRGVHWSCREDNFVSERTLRRRDAIKYNREHKEEIEQYRLSKKQKRLDEKIKKDTEDANAYMEWLSKPRFCRKCGKRMSEYYISNKYGKGVFCSESCVRSYVASLRGDEFYKKAMENRRSFAGENNPNYGKRASDELRKKFSDMYKNNEGVKNSPRFKGKAHTEESKRKISESMRKYYEEQKLKQH